MSGKRIVIAGGSGFIGTALAQEFSRRGYAVVILTRSPQARLDSVREVFWNGEQLGEWVQCLDGAEAVINLTGKNINCLHTPENLRAIIESRVNSVNAIALALAQMKTPSRAWVQASAVGFYGDTKAQPCDETAAVGHNALAQVCEAWEAGFNAAKVSPTRKATLRIGFVLGRNGGALPVLTKLTKCFLGGAAGDGKQYISWIHLADLVQMFATAVENENLFGVFNAVAPNAVTNAEFMRELRRALNRPWSPPVPKLAVKLGAWLMRGEPSLALSSQRCLPGRFTAVGFPFQFPNLPAALQDLCRQP